MTTALLKGVNLAPSMDDKSEWQLATELEHNFMGPVWRHAAGCYGRLEDHPGCEWDLPELTIGWQVIAWCSRYISGLDGGRWKFTDEQVRFMLWWYAVDETGFYTNRSGVLQRIKGWGKDPLGAVLCLVEFVGPSEFSHFDEDGEPVAVAQRRSWVQVIAVSRDQTRNTMTLMPALISKKMMQAYGIKLGIETIRAHMGRCRLEAVTSNPRSLEGGRSTFVLLNETHHWIKGNKGDEMYETLANNTAKMACRYLAITNAYLPGEDSVAEKMRDLHEKIVSGVEESIGMMYDSIEADESTPFTKAGLRAALPVLRGDAVWLNIEAIMPVAMNSSITEARRRRMWLNQIVSDKDALYSTSHLKTLVRSTALKAGDEIVLGFDGARYEDSSALVAIRIKDRVTFLIDVWEKPSTHDDKKKGRWETPVQAVDSAVRSAFRQYKVKAFFADVNLWESYIIEWTADYGQGLAAKATTANPIAYDMRSSVKEITRAHERFMGAINDSALFYDGDLTLRRHTMNVRKHETAYGTYFRKESQDTTRKIDCYAAWLLAHEALTRYLTGGAKNKKAPTGNGYFM